MLQRLQPVWKPCGNNAAYVTNIGCQDIM